MRIGFILLPGLTNSLYRVVYPMQALERRGHEVVWPARLDDDVPMRELYGCDLVHCFRREDRTADLEALSRRGVAISVDNDDDISELDIAADGRPSVGRRKANAKRSALLAAQARHADLVTTPSQVIADKYEAAGARNVVLIENYLDPAMECFAQPTKHAGVVVGWLAGREHAVDVGPLGIVSTLARLLDTHDDLRVVSAGIKLDLPKDRYEHMPWMEHRKLLAVVSRLDIGIAPLVDSPFNRARSNIKLKEYGAGGALWLASPVGAYLGLGVEQGGKLVADGGWYDALDQMIGDPRARRRLARRALKWAKRQTIDRHASIWEQEFERAIATAAARRPYVGTAERMR